MTRWLNDEEQRAWRAYLAATRLVDERLDRQLQQDSNMPHNYYEILVRLSDAPGRRMRMSDLADVAHSSRSRLSHAAARLEQAGWVRRESCPTDRRGSFAILTDEGYAALAEAAPGHVETVRDAFFDALTADQVGQLHTIMAAVMANLNGATRPVEDLPATA